MPRKHAGGCRLRLSPATDPGLASALACSGVDYPAVAPGLSKACGCVVVDEEGGADIAPVVRSSRVRRRARLGPACELRSPDPPTSAFDTQVPARQERDCRLTAAMGICVGIHCHSRPPTWAGSVVTLVVGFATISQILGVGSGFRLRPYLLRSPTSDRTEMVQGQ